MITDAKAYADSIGAIFIETSAKNNNNIQELFCRIGINLTLIEPILI